MKADPTSRRARLRLTLPLVVALVATAPSAVTAQAAGAPPRCNGQVANIVGTAGDDVLRGTPGRDVIVGLEGRDSIYGDDGDDLICASDNPEAVDSEGYPLTESLNGGRGDDRLFAASGRDMLVGGRGDDVLYGDEGDDSLAGVTTSRDENRGGFDRMFGGSGADTLRSATSRVVMPGGSGDDHLAGDDAADRLYGDAGADVLAPDAGNDHVHGGDGLDIVNYNDVIGFYSESSHRSTVVVNLTKGVARGRMFGTDQLHSSVEGASTGDGSDILIGNKRRNVFFGGFGERDVVDGRGGRDLLAFNSEEIQGACCFSVTLDLATGRGQAQSDHSQPTQLRVTNIEDVQGSGAADTLLGDRGPNLLIGGQYESGDGDDILDGRGGDDTLIGYGDNDTLTGGAGDDRLFGNVGDDRLDGGTGSNVLDGGAGTDSCVNGSSSTDCE